MQIESGEDLTKLIRNLDKQKLNYHYGLCLTLQKSIRLSPTTSPSPGSDAYALITETT